MVATSGLDLIVTIVWVSALTLILLARALVSWLRFRRTAAFAVQSRKLSEATGSITAPQAAARNAEVIPLRAPAPTTAARRSSKG